MTDRDEVAGYPSRALPKTRGTFDVHKHFDTTIRRARDKDLPPRESSKAARKAVESLVPTEREAPPADDTPQLVAKQDEEITRELAELRAKLTAKPPEKVHEKLFVLRKLLDMLKSDVEDSPSQVVSVLQAIVADYHRWAAHEQG